MVHLFLLTGFLTSAYAQEKIDLTTQQIEVYHQTLALNANAPNLLQTLSKGEKQHPFYYYLENLQDILKVLLSGDHDLYAELLEAEKSRLEILEDFPDDHPYKNYVIAEIKLQWAFVKLNFGDSFSAGWNIRQAFKILETQKEIFPDFGPNLKAQASLNVLIGAVPSRYTWLLNLLGMEGSILEGKSQFETLKQRNSEFSIEAAILSCLTGIYIFDDQNVIASFQPFYARLTTNKLVKFTYAMANFKGHNSELANQVIDECLQLQEGYFSIPYLNYFKGKILLQKQMYPQARYYFELFLKEHEGQNNVKDAYFQIFISYWLNNNESQAQKYFEIAKTKGKSISPADSYADNLLTQNEFPNQAIMQIRLATDGGYFELAQLLLSEIKTDEIKSEKEEIEVIYRRARLLHLQGNLNGAITYYQQTIQLSGENPWYFAPNSALQLGHIYLSQQKTAIAKDYYEMVFKYKHHPYKNSLNQEAKSALSRINN